MTIRRPAVAGAFYAASPERLREQIEDCFSHNLGPGRMPERVNEQGIVSVVCPHAGYVYSGPCAAHSYLALGEQRPPDTVIILGPNHTGWGTPVSIMSEGSWKTPLGDVSIDAETAKDILRISEIAKSDESAFIREHSLEVQLPFLQFIYPNFKFVPICMGYQDLETSIDIGKTIFESCEDKEIIVIASSDLNHQEPQERTKKLDQYVIDAIQQMDEKKLQESVQKHRISTCGYGPISATLVYSKLKEASSSVILSHYTSGDIVEDYSAVVGYASAKITRD